MKCEFCGGETFPRQVKRQHWLKHQLYIVEDVDAEVCVACGERYFHAKTLDAIDSLLTNQHPVKAVLRVEIVQFNRVAV